MKLLSADAFRAAAKGGDAHPEGTVFRYAAGDPVTVEGAQRTKRFVFSDATVDHSGDTIDPKGWDLAVFNRNPVALFSHMSWDPPIGRASNVKVVGAELVGEIEFAPPETYDFADTIFRLVDGGYLKAVSVGFMPKEWSWSSDKDRPYGIDFTKQTLLEISVCPVPCNPNALGEARSLGVDIRPLAEWAEKVLDSGDTVFLPRHELEGLRAQSKEAGPRRYYLQADRAVSPDLAKTARDAMRRWEADPSATLVLPKGLTLRAAEEWTCGAARDLPIDEEGDWDGPAAEASIFDHAGGDEFDPAIARKGFLAYDAGAPKLRGSYKLPFARVVGGELKAAASGIHAAAARLPQTDIPDAVKESAKAVLDHYEAAIADAKTAPILIVAAKSGRRISAATRATLEEAMGHHAETAKCIKALMDGDEEPDGEPEEEPVEEPNDDEERRLAALSPEERRLEEVAAIRADLPAID
ncbi:MAG TPA: HK97 family phage prohead protease [Caulobacteraceae bacterium]|jgi:HK97 family phage prohead protease